ncbi:MAG: Gfo/Idh/MocA family oxidoreductase [Calditrichia bacterium]
MQEIRWGIIGCGNVTEVKSGPALNLIQNSRLVAVMRRNGELAEDYANRHGVPRWYDDAAELIADEEVNAIYIATPPDSHAVYTKMAAEAGKPVYVEKPMARNFRECRRMIEVCRRAGVPLFVAYYRRRLPLFLKVEELVRSGAVGEVLQVTVSLFQSPYTDDFNKADLPWRVQPEISGGGYFVDLASHQLDYLDYLLGPVSSAKGFALNRAGLYPAEDNVSAGFEFESGVVGSGQWSFSVAEHLRRDRIEIIGSEGSLTFPCFAKGQLKLKTVNGVEKFDLPKPRHVQLPLLETVVAELLGQGKCPSTGESAARTNRVMDMILQEWREKNGWQE